MNNSNIPEGTENDPMAPWNQNDNEIDFEVPEREENESDYDYNTRVLQAEEDAIIQAEQDRYDSYDDYEY